MRLARLLPLNWSRCASATLPTTLVALAAVSACTPTPTPTGSSDAPAEVQGGARAEGANAGDQPEREERPGASSTAVRAHGERPAPEAIPAPSDVAAPPADAQRTGSGLASKVLEAGEGGDHPRAFDRVTVNYTGWTTDGKMFDSSVTRGRPAVFPLNRVIPGWTEGLQLMVKGEKRRLWIPGDLAYDGQPGRPQGMLVFDVELVDIERMPEPPSAPADVAAAPADAQRTASGLASKVLSPGTGTEHPQPNSVVTVHYSGWTTDGQMFDSSVTRGRPASFPLDRVIPGWTEGVQLMVVGEKRRFWVPANLAYEGRPGAPQGTLVFDVELLEIKPPAQPRGRAPRPTPVH